MTVLSKDGIRWLVPSNGRSVESVMWWSSTDPIAVQITFHDSVGDVAWQFARDLIAYACTVGQAGRGDVRVAVAGDKLTLSLHSLASLVLETEVGPVFDFVQRTYEVVAPGKEDTSVAIDECIRNSLEGT